ncbi:unnamed protein product [Ostreobium quekettii]|uniref:SOUL heme-binding protein n=1 Tax=Ostreobium quekettii TaxID=121088 RepID=A0A8S1J6C1_9CHLO|nr:unnamed protein product [Ostreobium quekettii]|eukprot:evm.model.scf_532.1 EVM.evm.TU.scf_532.1   scf_532:11195-15415(-)
MCVAAAATWEAPAFCRGLDCPTFTNASAGQGVDLRTYDAAVWVHTQVNESDVGQARAIAITRLDRYIFGYNDGDHYIQTTTPLVTEMKTNATSYVVSFFLPFVYQDSPPVPSSPDVFIEARPISTFYVSSFGGFAKSQLVAEEAQKLRSELQAMGAAYDSDAYFVAEYDSPFKAANRHNEIWYRQAPPAAEVVV